MAGPFKRAAVRVHEFMDKYDPTEFTTEGEMFETAFSSGVQAVREEFARDARDRRKRRALTGKEKNDE